MSQRIEDAHLRSESGADYDNSWVVIWSRDSKESSNLDTQKDRQKENGKWKYDITEESNIKRMIYKQKDKAFRINHQNSMIHAEPSGLSLKLMHINHENYITIENC